MRPHVKIAGKLGLAGMFGALGALGVVGAIVAACGTTSTNAAPTGVKCTPGNYVFCRCEDRSEGTKLCRPDGVSFDECKCDGTGGPITPDPDAGLGTEPLEPVDSGGPVMGPTIDAKCTGKLGLVAGGGAASDLDAFVATYSGAGLFAISKSAGPGLRGPATILPVGASLVATYLSRYQLIAWTKLQAGSWSAPVSVGNATSTAATAAVLLSGQVRLLYLANDAHYRMGTYGATGWDDATALAEPGGDSGAPIPGKSAPAAAVVGSSITLAFSGNDGSLARETYSSGSWSTITKFPAITAYAAAPVITALDPGGTKDELMVYGGSDLLLHVATREASNKVWNTPILFDTAASSTELTLAPLPGGKAMLVYKASNGKGYYSVWASGAGFSPPAELVPGKNPDLASVPSLTRGACGSDATIAYAQKDGLVKLLRFTGGTMSAPYDVGGLAKIQWVGVGELP